MRALGAKPKVISEALGHASVVFTMDTYAHIIEGMQRDDTNRFDDVLAAGRANVTNVKHPKRRARRCILAASPCSSVDRAAVS